MEYFGELLVKFFGLGYLGGTLSLAIIRSAWPDDVITVKGTVREKTIEGEKVRLMLDVWCENQHGEKVMVGTASGLVP
jgi:acyl dehydratase